MKITKNLKTSSIHQKHHTHQSSKNRQYTDFIEHDRPKPKTNHVGKGRLAKLSQQAAKKHLEKLEKATSEPPLESTDTTFGPSSNFTYGPNNASSQRKPGQMYVDWSMMGSKLENSPFINWYDPKTGKAEYQWDKIDGYLNSLFKSMHDNGMDTMDMAFGQLSDVDSWANGKASMSGTGAYDSISQLLAQMNKSVPGAGKEMMQHIAADAKANGISLDISMGGANANEDCMKLTPQSGADLVKFCKEYGISSIDFDLEGTGLSGFEQNSPSQINNFLRTLQQNGIATTLTTTASVNTNKSLFENLAPDVKKNMAGYNIMAYSASTYYCSANNPDWGAEAWENMIGKENASKLNWGFYDAINYKKPSDGDISNGAAAAKRFNEMNEQLKRDGYPPLTGKPFFWPDVGDQYDPVNGKCDLINSFEKDFMKSV